MDIKLLRRWLCGSVRVASRVTLVWMAAAVMVACGGGGGGGGGNASTEPTPPPVPTTTPTLTPTASPTSTPTTTPTGSPTSTPTTTPNPTTTPVESVSPSITPTPEPTLSLGAPTANPAVLPPSGLRSSVRFSSVVRGNFYPDYLILDQIDADGRVIAADVARLLDDGEGEDAVRGDQSYAGQLRVESLESEARRYRVRAALGEQEVVSGAGAFWISGCPSVARPSNPAKALLDSRLSAYVFVDELRITVDDSVAPSLSGINALVGAAGGQVVGCMPALGQYLLELPNSQTLPDLDQAIAQLKAQPGIVEVSPNVQILSLPEPTVAGCNGAECQWFLERIRAPEAWAIAGGGDQQMGVAVIDFGVDCNHLALDCDGSLFTSDPIDHGTGVASLIAGQPRSVDGGGDSVSLQGVAWNTRLYPYSFIGQGGSQYKMSELITLSMAEQNIRVINISAATALDPGFQIRDAMCSAIDSGRLIVAAAGNAAVANNCQLSNVYPARYNAINPANTSAHLCPNGADLARGLVVVGATDTANQLAQWGDNQLCSNTLYVDVFAPGKDILTASTGQTLYANKDGTSFAAPLAAGSAAVLWATQPELSVSEVHDRLVGNASALSPEASDPRHHSEDSRLQGQSLLDLYRAVGGRDERPAPQRDLDPDSFTFTDQQNVPRATFINAAPITITGIDDAVPIAVLGGYYALDGGHFTSASGMVRLGQQVILQVRSASQSETAREATLMVGSQQATFRVTTAAAITTPNDFAFIALSDAPLNQAIFSEALTLSGFNDPLPIRIEGGHYALDGGAFTDQPGNVSPNQQVQVRLISALTPETERVASLSIGDSTRRFVVTTERLDQSPRPFHFAALTQVAPGSPQESEVITVAEINSAAVISISGGEYRIDGGDYRRDAGSVRAGQSVQVRHSSASGFGSDSFSTLSIGSYSATFRSTTRLGDTTPEAFSFSAQDEVERDSLLVSDTITVSGIDSPASIQIEGGDYRLDEGSFTSNEGQVRNGQRVQVRLRSASDFSSASLARLTIGGVSVEFRVTTLAADSAPEPFSFTNQSQLQPGQVITQSLTVSGINTATPIRLSSEHGARYRINDGAFTSDDGLVNNNDRVELQLSAAATLAATTSATLSIGGLSATLNLSTEGINPPDDFTLPGVADAALDSWITSSERTITGLNTAVEIRISGGEYRLDQGEFSALPGLISNNQRVQVRLRSAASFSSTRSATLSIGGISNTFSVTTLAADTTPEPFAFAEQDNVAGDSLITSNSVTIGGINTATPISISGGEYRINAGTFTTAAGTINNGDSVAIRVRSATTGGATSQAQLTIGGVSASFRVTTQNDTTPTVFSFTAQTGVAVNTLIVSNSVTISGINTATPISVTGGEYRINSGSFTTTTGTINNGDSVTLRLRSATTGGVASQAQLTIGSVSGSFSVTTLSDTTPDAFAFSSQNGVAQGSLITSNTVTISGINTAAPISVFGGDYRINSGTFTNETGTINNGDTLTLRQRSANSFATTTEVQVIVGGINRSFFVTTLAADTVPDTFSFTAQTDVAVDTQITSNSITVSGINTTAPISVTGGEYRINAGSFTSAAGTVNNGDSVTMRVRSATTGGVQSQAQLTIGGVSGSFSVTTLSDTTPNAFSFTAQTGVALDTLITSNTITISGINTEAPISVTGGEYRINAGTFTTVAGTINNGDNVTLRLISATTGGQQTQSQLTIGGVSATFRVTTLVVDTTPDAFSFTQVTNTSPDTLTNSNTITVSGINSPSPISISGGVYRINTGSYTNSPGTVNNGDQVTLQLRSAASYDAGVQASLTIGGVVGTFRVSTGNRPDYDLDDNGLIEINSLADLDAIRQHLDGAALFGSTNGCPATGCIGFELTRDLDFDTNRDGVMDAGDAYWNGGLGWVAIGSSLATPPFRGVFEGNGYRIANLYIDRPNAFYQGLFGSTLGAQIRHLALTGALARVRGSGYLGSVVGQAESTELVGIVSGVVLPLEGDSGAYSGGLIGAARASQIRNCIYTGAVEATDTYVGGLVGSLSHNSLIEASFSTAAVRSTYLSSLFKGGVVGSSSGSTLSRTHWATDTSGQTSPGYSATGATGATLSQLQCPTGATNTTCANVTLYEGWDTFTDPVTGEAYWDFGSDTQLPALRLKGRLYSDSDGDGVLDEEDDFPNQYAASIDRDDDGYPDDWTRVCGITCITNSGLHYDHFPQTGGAWQDDDLDAYPDSWHPDCDLACQQATSRSLDPYPNDRDNDNIPDDRDSDSNNDGVPDADSNGNGLLEIYTLAQLNAARNDLDGFGLVMQSGGVRDSSGCPTKTFINGLPRFVCHGYELMADLDFDTNEDGLMDAGDTYWNGGEGWMPIGTSSLSAATRFRAVFEGNGYRISNLYINRPNANYQGLFGYTHSAQIRHLALTGALARVRGGGYLGSVAGVADSTQLVGLVSGVAVGLESTSGLAMGGLIGYANTSQLHNSVYTGTVETQGTYVGGLVGLSNNSFIETSFSTAWIRSTYSSTWGIGGVVGNGQGSTTVSRIHWATDTSGQTSPGEGVTGAIGATLAQLQCPTSANNAICANGVMLYEGWDTYLNPNGEPYWDFGDDRQLPGLNLNGWVYRDSDGDGVLDEDEVNE